MITPAPAALNQSKKRLAKKCVDWQDLARNFDDPRATPRRLVVAIAALTGFVARSRARVAASTTRPVLARRKA
jgi:hypothetical protein